MISFRRVQVWHTISLSRLMYHFVLTGFWLFWFSLHWTIQFISCQYSNHYCIQFYLCYRWTTFSCFYVVTNPSMLHTNCNRHITLPNLSISYVPNMMACHRGKCCCSTRFRGITILPCRMTLTCRTCYALLGHSDYNLLMWLLNTTRVRGTVLVLLNIPPLEPTPLTG